MRFLCSPANVLYNGLQSTPIPFAMSTSRWKSELSEIPAFPFAELASEPVRLLLAGLAERDGLPLKEWLALRLRSWAVMALPCDVRDRVLTGHLENFFSRSPTPIDYVALSFPSQPKDVPDDASFWLGVTRMADDIKAAGAALRELRQQATPARGRHALWRAQTTEPAKVYPKDDSRHQWNKQLQDMGPSRDIVRVNSAMVRRVEQLLADAPNLREATLFVLGQMALARRGQRELRLPPLLLAGPPAAGKTWWAEQLAKALGVHSEVITLPSMSASFELAGGSAQWRNGTPGYIARSFLRTPLASPLFVLDEIDKPIQDNSYPVAPVLLGLIDRSSATRWHDEFFDLDFDVSRSIFVATANKPEKMDPALRSRFRRIDVYAPKRSERAAMVASVWRQYRAIRADLQLPKVLSADVVDLLALQIDDARHLMRLLDEALGRAARRRGRLQLIASDVGGPVASLVASSKDVPPAHPHHR